MNKSMARIKKKGDEDTEDKDKTPIHNTNVPMFKSAIIKNMDALLEQHINENDNTSQPGGPSGIAGGSGIGHEEYLITNLIEKMVKIKTIYKTINIVLFGDLNIKRTEIEKKLGNKIL